MKGKIKRKLFLILFLPGAIILKIIAGFLPDVVENIYSTAFYHAVVQIISRITGVLPFSLAEILIIAIIIFVVSKIIHIVIKIFKDRKTAFKTLANSCLNLLIIICIIYFSFLVLWGFNYQRQPFSTSAGMDVRPSSVNELYNVCDDIINRANTLRSKVTVDKNGCMYIPGGFKSVSSRAYMGYIAASKKYPQLSGTFGRPKAVLLSEAMCYEGITGVYFPFTGEANVNIKETDSFLPCTACHEMAHQRGFAREDEANYISYYVCSLHPDPDFQYSGLLLALLNSMNALYGHNQEMYTKLAAKYSSGLKRDLIQNDMFWQKYEGPVQKISDKINDAYLKSNLQQDGVYSYGRMVDLLIAEYRSKNALH